MLIQCVGVRLYVPVHIMVSMFVSDGVQMCMCEFARDWHRRRLIHGGPMLQCLEETHNNLSDVLNVTTVIYGIHYSEWQMWNLSKQQCELGNFLWVIFHACCVRTVWHSCVFCCLFLVVCIGISLHRWEDQELIYIIKHVLCLWIPVFPCVLMWLYIVLYQLMYAVRMWYVLILHVSVYTVRLSMVYLACVCVEEDNVCTVPHTWAAQEKNTSCWEKSSIKES